ncbi:MAG: hypothetical protein NVSMB57_03870 [Actinomycetota bacterium]
MRAARFRHIAKTFAAAVVATIGLLITLPLNHASAVTCTPPSFPNTPEARYTIRKAGMVVLGRVSAASVPKDAHGKWSIFFDIEKFYSGEGHAPNHIEITNYARTDDLPQGYEKPGNAQSKQQSGRFLIEFGGQEAIVFLRPDDARGRDPNKMYAGEFMTNDCSYTVFGTKQLIPLKRLLDRLFALPASALKPTAPPSPAPTTPSVAPSTQAHAAPSRSTGLNDDRGTLATRAGALIVIVGGALVLYANPRSPLFQRWRDARKAGHRVTAP